MFLRGKKETISISGSTTYSVEEEASDLNEELEFFIEMEATERYYMEERISERSEERLGD